MWESRRPHDAKQAVYVDAAVTRPPGQTREHTDLPKGTRQGGGVVEVSHGKGSRAVRQAEGPRVCWPYGCTLRLLYPQ